MAKLQKLQCDNCGGKIDGSTLICQSCGMQFRLDDGPNGFTLGRVEVYHGKFHLIQGHVSVPVYALKEPKDFERAAEWTLTDMSKRMAVQLLPLMEFQSMFRPEHCAIDTYAQMRVAEPGVSRENYRIMHNVAQDWINTMGGL